jgi:hypothetical protein
MAVVHKGRAHHTLTHTYICPSTLRMWTLFSLLQFTKRIINWYFISFIGDWWWKREKSTRVCVDTENWMRANEERERSNSHRARRLIHTEMRRPSSDFITDGCSLTRESGRGWSIILTATRARLFFSSSGSLFTHSADRPCPSHSSLSFSVPHSFPPFLPPFSLSTSSQLLKNIQTHTHIHTRQTQQGVILPLQGPACWHIENHPAQTRNANKQSITNQEKSRPPLPLLSLPPSFVACCGGNLLFFLPNPTQNRIFFSSSLLELR